MKNLFAFILISVVNLNVMSQDYMNLLSLGRTHFFKYGKETATIFIVEHKAKPYFITAKHMFGQNDKKISFEIMQNSKWQKVNGTVYFHSIPTVDIAVIVIDKVQGFDVGIPINHNELTLGDNCFFLGFPFGMSTDDQNQNQGFPLPFIKRAYLSSNIVQNNVITLYLDGHNNPGFSGGPVLFKNRKDSKDPNLYLGGVISGYVNQWNEIVSPIGNLPYKENSGIIVAYGANHIIQIIEANNL